tara:strand:- start:1586 stop:2503 length:918 start_codon:yes stop_codon:yes gene_type:complete
LVEKTISLDKIDLVEFLGVENKNFIYLESIFPNSKILSRGNKIVIKGNNSETVKIQNLILSLIKKYEIYGSINEEDINSIHKNGKINDEKKLLYYGSKGKRINALSKNQNKFVDSCAHNDIVFVIGPAGTGKTFLSVVLAVKALKEKIIEKIVITRPVVEAGENLGFLPGDLQDKINPYLRPIYDSLDEILPKKKIKQFIDNGIIEIVPLAYMRGRTLKNSYILLDEAQNTVSSQIKMFLTRMGKNSKMIITGDITQIDLKSRKESGLVDAIKRFNNTEGIGIVQLKEQDVLRHKLVKKILSKYN